MYAKCGSIEDVWTVFNMMPAHDVVSWSTMILGYVKCGQGQKALDLFQQKGWNQSLSPLSECRMHVLVSEPQKKANALTNK
jgi:pentatricopeptide repeat protein